MQIHKKYKEFDIVISNDNLYSLNSTDNTTYYDYAYIREEDKGYNNLSKHGIQLIKDEKVQNSAIVLCSGGGTGIHESCCIFDENLILICCGDSVFCLELPSLLLNWQTKVDFATSFEIVKYEDCYIVHGELEITRLNAVGEKVWSFCGPDIFITAEGETTFKLFGDIVYAKEWNGQIFQLDAYTGEIISDN